MNSFYQISKSVKNEILEMIDQNQGSIVEGNILCELEKKFAFFGGNQFGLAFCNGTASIHSALFALSVSNGDEIIVPTYGFHAMVTPILLLGGVPVFCDISCQTLCAELQHIDKVKTNKTKGILLLHPWGNVADVENIRNYALENGLFIINDASHAHGALYKGKHLGRFADITCASLGKGKLITGGELGVATTDSELLWDRMALFSHVNRVPKSLKTNNYSKLTNSIGPKYRPHGLSLPLALDQLKSFNTRMKILMGNISKLSKIIEKSRIFRMQAFYKNTSRVFWKIIVVIENDYPQKVKERVFDIAEKYGVSIEKNHYSPLLHEDYNYKSFYNIPSCNETFPNAEHLKGRIFQIHAPLLYDNSTTNRYCEMFGALENSL